MNHFRKSTRGALLYSPISLGILVIVAAFIAHATWDVYNKNEESAAAAARAGADLSALQHRQIELEAENNELTTPRGVESEIRAKYGVAKPQEQVYVIVDDKNATATNGTTTGPTWWTGLKALFGR